MYDAVDDPYTYENSTVLVNKLELREQAELDEFEAEISSARADEPLPEGNLDFTHDGSAFADKAAHFLAELNAIHAFAKATAVRSSRSLPRLADHAGHPIDLDKLDPSEMLDAMIASFDGDEAKLANVIKDLIR